MKKENSKNNCHFLAGGNLVTHTKIPGTSPRTTAENGRSMVEMLGVLAIIGVLSIVGIAGYRKAMDKLHANDLINDTSRIAHQVAFERQMNPTNETMESLLSKHNPFTQYPVDFSTNTEQTFSLAMKNSLDKGLCIQVMKMNWSLPIAISLNNEQLTPPLSEDKCANSNTLSFTFANDLGSGEAEPTQEACPEGISRARDGTCSICDNGKVYLSYNENPCEEEISGDCTNNNDCVTGEEYCDLKGYDSESPTEGTCESIGHVDDGSLTLNNQTKTVYYRHQSRSYWAAENWCRAQGKRIPSLTELGITGGYENECRGTGCGGADWTALKSAISGSCWYWTTTGNTSAQMYSINPHEYGGEGGIWHLNRNDGSYGGENCALCVDN